MPPPTAEEKMERLIRAHLAECTADPCCYREALGDVSGVLTDAVAGNAALGPLRLVTGLGDDEMVAVYDNEGTD